VVYGTGLYQRECERDSRRNPSAPMISLLKPQHPISL